MREYRAGGQGFNAGMIRLMCRVFVWTTLAVWPLSGPLARLMPLVDIAMRPVPRLRSVEVDRVRTSTWRAEWVRPRRNARTDGAILYLHGGAFVFCGLATHRRIVERLALRTGLPVLSVEYRQLPKGRLDESLADAADAVSWLAKRGIAPENIVYIGDSAGGHLAFALALNADRTGLARPAGIVGLSPWLEFDSRTKQEHPNAHQDVFIPVRRLPRVAGLVAGGGDGTVDPTRSPINADLTTLPPVLIQCAEDEVLRLDAELMAERLTDAGVRHTLQVWQGQVHAFPVLAHTLRESRAALDEIAAFIADVSPARAPEAA